MSGVKNITPEKYKQSIMRRVMELQEERKAEKMSIYAATGFEPDEFVKRILKDVDYCRTLLMQMDLDNPHVISRTELMHLERLLVLALHSHEPYEDWIAFLQAQLDEKDRQIQELKSTAKEV